MLNLKDLIHHFVEHRHEIVVRRTKYDLAEAKKRTHILEGLLIALDNLDAVINLIRGSKNPDEAKDGLMGNFGLTEIQSKAILDLRLQRLTGLERQKIKEEFDELMKQIAYLESILKYPAEWTIATCSAANNLIKLKLLLLVFIDNWKKIESIIT